MDINCVLDCIYQNDGKCHLTDLSNLSNICFNEDDIECPYMEKKIKKYSGHTQNINKYN